MQLFTAADQPDQPFEQQLTTVLTGDARQPAIPLPRRTRSAARRSQPRSANSTSGNSPRASRTSCGAACPTTNCSISPAAAQLRAQLPSQVERMLHDPKIERTGRKLRRPMAANSPARTARLPDAKLFPSWNAGAAQPQCIRKRLSLFAYIMAEDRSLLEFIDAAIHVSQRALGRPSTASTASKATNSAASICPPTARAAA